MRKFKNALISAVFFNLLTLNAQATTPFEVTVSKPTWIAGSKKSLLDVKLPPEVTLNHSNNNVGIAIFSGRRFIAFRTAPTHFASTKTHMMVMSSGDDGATWDLEQDLWVGRDIREPFFLNFNGRLIFSFMTLGKKALAFEPFQAMRIEYLGSKGQWTKPEVFLEPKEMVWEVKARNGEAWMTSYVGNHYRTGSSNVKVNFRHSADGIHWQPVRKDGNPTVYVGGVSEVGFDFDREGNLWAVTRNEDGDQSGWGSHVVKADASDLGNWQFPAKSNPYRYDSPRMFQWNGEVFLLARTNLGRKFDMGRRWLGFELQKWFYLIRYSFTPKGFAIQWLNRETRELEEVARLPGNGDTAFPSVVQLNDDRFLIANYTNPLGRPKMPWITGQTSKKGTWIYSVELDLKKRP